MNTFKLLRIYTAENAYSGTTKVFQLICEGAREQQIAGATVLDARLGFGRNAHLRRRHILEDERSVVIEIIDEDVKLSASPWTVAPMSLWRPLTQPFCMAVCWTLPML